MIKIKHTDFSLQLVTRELVSQELFPKCSRGKLSNVDEIRCAIQTVGQAHPYAALYSSLQNLITDFMILPLRPESQHGNLN